MQTDRDPAVGGDDATRSDGGGQPVQGDTPPVPPTDAQRAAEQSQSSSSQTRPPQAVDLAVDDTSGSEPDTAGDGRAGAGTAAPAKT